VRALVLLAAVGLLVACGTKKPDAYAQQNTALLATLPVYPGAAAPKTSAGVSSSTEFGARDWTLPAQTNPEAVVDWYIPRLTRGGWRIVGKSAGTIRAVRGPASLDVGVRARTLEAIVDARGHPSS
jgi:hypothetical protein